MRLRKLKIKNIRSYQEQEIDFPEGSLMLAGDVGSGKTSILLAIEYALFGLQPGQTGSALLRNNSQIGEVTLEFELAGKEVIIERKLKRGKSVVNDYSSITVDGEKTECSITELKSKIISLLGYPPEFIKKNNILYRYTVYTPQEQMKNIISEEAEVRLNILRHIFGIDKYKTIRENLTILLSKLKEDSKSLQGEILSLESDKISILAKSDAIKILEHHLSNQETISIQAIKKRKVIEVESSGIEQKIKEGEKLETELEKAKVMLVTKKDSLSSIQRETLEMESSLIENKEIFKEEELYNLILELEKNADEIERLNNSYIELVSQINSLKQIKNDTSIKKEKVFSIDICPTCLQDVPIAHKHNILNETEQTISKLTKEIENLEEKKALLPSKIEALKKEKLVLEKKKVGLEILRSKVSEVERLKKKLGDSLKNKASLEKDISLLTTHLEDLKASILDYSRFSNIYRLKQDELKKAFMEEKRSEIAAAEFRKELELTRKEIALLNQKIQEKETKKNKLNSVLELSDWLSGQFTSLVNFTERNVMLRLRSEFSKLFSKWFLLLVQDSFDVHLDENFTPLITQAGIEMDYSFLSGGERTAVALAYRLALNQTINSVITTIKTRDFIILDEPTDGFSDAQIDKLREVLIELNAAQLILVSHEQKIEGFVDHIIKIKRDGDSSKTESTV